MKMKVTAGPSAAIRLNSAEISQAGRILLGSLTIVLVMFMTAYAAKAVIDDDLLGVSFPEAEKGWVCGRYGSMYHSTDGGKTWSAQATYTDATLASVFFVDPKNGWAAGDGSTIIHTMDGGKTWTQQKSPVSDSYLMDVFFVSTTKGWIVTERSRILHTDNGGKTWTIQFSDLDIFLKALSFSDPLNGWAVGEYGFIYHTSDGGAHWEKQAGEYNADITTGQIIGGHYLFGVTAVDSKRAWAVGIDGYVVKTLNGGKTWEVVPTGSGTIAFTSISNNGPGKMLAIARKEEGIIVSTDEGQTWTKPPLQPSIGYGWVYR
ncbi:MAG: hypothetical protein HKP58_04890, partial [Desulfatitalea sp.]|nr:hypothetical protein [Desulfatitalea sp.]NNJ99729.1 hypothetical protein [Desulfatitalea sp.]